MAVRPLYLAIAGGGGLLLWSGLKGKRWTDVLRNLVSGKSAQAALTAYAITGTPASDSSTVGGITSSGPIASFMLAQVGKTPYVSGGGNPSGWDCSGAFNYCANHDSGVPIPGYGPHQFSGVTHGPTTFVYVVWAPFHWQKLSRTQVMADDVCLWQSHMGVAIDNTKYVSAYDTQDGTCVKPIDGGGPFGEIPTYWRIQ